MLARPAESPVGVTFNEIMRPTASADDELGRCSDAEVRLHFDVRFDQVRHCDQRRPI
jgi:hypothetical protein